MNAGRPVTMACRSRAVVWISAVLLPLLLAGCSIQMKDITQTGTAAAEPKRCGECHVEIYRDWQASKHAKAFSDPQFLEATLHAQAPACLSCHAPLTVFAKGAVETRDDRREEGITCDACHLFEGAQHGPFAPGPVTPHPVTVDPVFYHSSEICGKCHEGTFAEWLRIRERDPKTQTCQECHMPPIRRKITQATDLLSTGIVALHDEHDLRRHLFDLQPVENAFGIDASRNGAELTVKILNRIPHSAPTGDFGARRALANAEWLDANAAVVAKASRDLDKRAKTQLDPNAILTLSARQDSPARPPVQVRVRMMRIQADGKPGEVFWDSTTPLSGATAAP